MRDDKKYTLESPFMELGWDRRPDNWKLIFGAWVIGWLVFFFALIAFYSTIFKDWVGFETAVLVGIGFVLFFLSGLD